jgi:hypothetical protein
VANLERLYTVRWAGYSGPIIGIGGPDALDARSRTLLSLEAVIAPRAVGLREAVAQSQLRVSGTQ